MFLTPVRIWTLLCLVLALQLATAQSFQLVQRADASAPTTRSPEETGRRGDEGNKNDDSKTASSDADASASRTVTTTTRNSTASETRTSTPIVPTPTSLGNTTFVNATVPHGQLPLAPQLTPGWGVAGIIMLATGLVYAVIGIKNPWIHAFFSTAFMAALGVAVLIIYVMTVPVSNALQGGYVAAIVLSGCAIGTGSMFFKELTEGLGCALGGFCFSMWLLCLVPGGLLHSTPAKAIFIACFTIVGFGFYFSRFTRDWSLIVGIAFGGATIAVLGIDCFSRAGLKEFWAWIWALNDNLFPLGADTYPVTRGIRVETAAIVIIFLVATMSQVRLWKIVREKREKRAALRAHGQRNLEEEEEVVGRHIEESNARERAEWERVYGDGGAESITASQLSETGHVHEKNVSHSQIYAARRHSGDATEMDDMSELGQRGMDRLMTGEAEEGRVTVRVGADEVPERQGDEEAEDDEEIARNEKASEDASVPHDTSTRSKRASVNTATSGRVPVRSSIVTPSPEVVPLPFSVPRGHLPRSERSSVATFADVEEEVIPANSRRIERHSVVKRLSRGSVELLRSLSQRSGRSANTPDLGHEGGESTEMLLTQIKSHRQDRDNDSLAATVDMESVSGDERGSMRTADDDVEEVDSQVEATAADATPEKVASGVAEATTTDSAALDQSNTASKDSKRQGTTAQNKQGNFRSQVVTGPAETEAPDEPINAPQSEIPESAASGTSGPVSLTKERLPRPMSKIALSYRTNEWAKHLSNADLPDMDDLPVEKPNRVKKATKERARPVNVEDLQRTAQDGTPAPALPRSVSRMSTMSTSTTGPTQVTMPATPVLSHETPGAASPNDTTTTARSQLASSTSVRKLSPTVQPILEEERAVSVASGALPVTREEELHMESDIGLAPENDQFVKPAATIPGIVSYASPQTLLGQREMFLRSRSQGSLLNTVDEMQTTATPPMTAPSEADSIHNYPMYAAAFASDPDEMPLSQRRSMILGSRMSHSESTNSLNRATSRAGSVYGGVDNLTFNSHQPKRVSGLPTQAARDTQLANFRMSVSQDLRAGNPMINSGGRETPFASTNSLLGGREAEVQRNIEMQRHVLMGQKEAEAQRREMQRRDKEFSDRAFDDRMRSGDLADAHREALRKMQRSAGQH
ncbi:hypothetical protein V2A60_004954 [Cordyceps javanica]|uniref:TM7S3/TM198-like domain-containing protein n=1 Tax=Cordyceps javanica TaxID=43265 RepID=A0A545VCP8_9HYPO|nr:hypothetical protein IF1G_01695 [Cordyceps javanica]TQW10842.1 hypothetical protein IF2G_01784 [Cordyceps javanica]